MSIRIVTLVLTSFSANNQKWSINFLLLNNPTSPPTLRELRLFPEDLFSFPGVLATPLSLYFCHSLSFLLTLSFSLPTKERTQRNPMEFKKDQKGKISKICIEISNWPFLLFSFLFEGVSVKSIMVDWMKGIQNGQHSSSSIDVTPEKRLLTTPLKKIWQQKIRVWMWIEKERERERENKTEEEIGKRGGR